MLQTGQLCLLLIGFYRKNETTYLVNINWWWVRGIVFIKRLINYKKMCLKHKRMPGNAKKRPTGYGKRLKSQTMIWITWKANEIRYGNWLICLVANQLADIFSFTLLVISNILFFKLFGFQVNLSWTSDSWSSINFTADLTFQFHQAMKELYLVKQRMKQLMADMTEVTKDREKTREDADMFREERDAARRERHEAIIHRDKILRECFEAKQRNDTFKGDSKESETLRKQFDALSKELANALSEAEVSKKRRDWSFSERDKMVKVIFQLLYFSFYFVHSFVFIKKHHSSCTEIWSSLHGRRSREIGSCHLARIWPPASQVIFEATISEMKCICCKGCATEPSCKTSSLQLKCFHFLQLKCFHFFQERDAAKAACDVLRQERDRAVSDLAALLRDTDQIRREQSNSMEELKTLREKIKLRLETDDRSGVLTSMDSAIDTDSCTVSNVW